MDAAAVPVQAPGCKSASQRALVLAALARGDSRLAGLGTGDDTRELRAALEGLGYRFADGADGAVEVRGSDGPLPAEAVTVDAGLGASTLRFLLALLGASACDVTVRAAPALRARPHDDLLRALHALGARVTATDAGFRVRSAGFRASRCTVSVQRSSQPLSGLMLAAGAQVQTWLTDGAPVSRGYLDLTLEMLGDFRGADAVHEDDDAFVQRAGYGRGRACAVPADASGVLFFAVAAALTGRAVVLDRSWSTAHPDATAIAALADAGWLELDPPRLAPRRPTDPRALDFDLAHAPDAGPALAAFGACTSAGARLRHAGRLRLKESDRVAGIARLVEACGGRLEEQADDLLVHPPAPGTRAPAGEVDPAGDHRLAMAAGVARLLHPRISVRDPGCVSKSFPGFWESWQRLA